MHAASRPPVSRKTWIATGVALAAILALAGGLSYWRISSQRVYVESASIEAPLIDLAASQPGTLEETYVQAGDRIAENAAVARVGNELIKANVAGIVVSVPKSAGTPVNPGEPVVTMIDPAELRVVGKVDEDKGLDRIAVGDRVEFRVDAFGSGTFDAVVDEIAPISDEAGVVFSISDKRAVKRFEVKARFDTSAHPELKTGMSARMWIYGE